MSRTALADLPALALSAAEVRAGELLAAGRLTVTGLPGLPAGSAGHRAAGTAVGHGGEMWEVAAWAGGGACTCPAARFAHAGELCKHVAALQLVTGLTGRPATGAPGR